jgi:tetratricopeptide (TPR) repeat protein
MKRAALALLLAACATTPREAPRLPPTLAETPPPPDPPPAEVLAALARADAAFKAGQWADAARDYERALALHGGPAITLHLQIGLALVPLGEHARALGHLQAVLDADPGNAAVRAAMARSAIASGDMARALDLLRGLEGTAAPPDLFFDAGAHFVNANQPHLAIAYFTRALAREPAYVDAYFRRGMAYLQVGRTEDAKRDLRIVVELAPETRQAESAREALARLR